MDCNQIYDPTNRDADLWLSVNESEISSGFYPDTRHLTNITRLQKVCIKSDIRSKIFEAMV